MTREEAIHELGRQVLDRVDEALPGEGVVVGEQLLVRVVEAFPHTSIGELVDLMVAGLTGCDWWVIEKHGALFYAVSETELIGPFSNRRIAQEAADDEGTGWIRHPRGVAT